MCFPQRAANMIPAHDSPLAALAFDASGTKLATASEKVTLKDTGLLSSVCFPPERVNITAVASPLSVTFVFHFLFRAQSSESSQSQRDRSSLSFGEESRGRLFTHICLYGNSTTTGFLSHCYSYWLLYTWFYTFYKEHFHCHQNTLPASLTNAERHTLRSCNYIFF